MARAETAFPVEIGIGILVSIPFTSTIFQGGLSSIPTEIYEAARIDGASGVQQFRFLTLPLLQPFITIAVVLNIIHVFNSFPIIWVMTQGGPDNGTHILVTYAYELAFRLGRPGPAAAVSVVMLAIVFVFTGIYLRLRGTTSDATNPAAAKHRVLAGAVRHWSCWCCSLPGDAVHGAEDHAGGDVVPAALDPAPLETRELSRDVVAGASGHGDRSTAW